MADHCIFERGLRLPNESSREFYRRVDRVARYARTLIHACIRNRCVQLLIADSDLAAYTVDSFRESPVVRIDYDEAYAIATLAELSVTERKRWGDGPWIMPIAPDEYVDPYFVTYCYKPNSKHRQRYEQRQRLKELLGRQHRSLVRLAQRNTKTRFLAELDEAAAVAIGTRTRLDAGTFWRAAKGHAFPPLPLKPKQLTLFET